MSEKFEVGQIVQGTVTGVKPFGAFVALDGNTQGLVHISHVTHGFLKNINDAVSVGDEVKVKILSIDAQSGKIALSMKETQPSPKQYHSHQNHQSKAKKPSAESFDDLMKDFLKSSNERQAILNKRYNR